MGLIECTSSASLWRGYDYYKARKVRNLKKINDTQYTADVDGTMSEPYKVHIDVLHPRTSKCNCPHADGKHIVCKHMIAAYFTAFPQEAQRIYEEYIACQEEEERREEELSDKICQYVWQMKKSEVQQALLELLFDGPNGSLRNS